MPIHRPWFLALPFIALLLVIALLPLKAPHFWEKNRNKSLIALLLSVPVLVYFFRQGNLQPIQHSLIEYFSFICLLGSLFVISGGVHLMGDLAATPRTNTLFLLVGAVLANLVGTTGASMLLIRPFLLANQEREHKGHLPIFFIFVVSNVGGLLTPLGDPPLFLGYLRGVPFFWTLQLFPVWLVSIGFLLTLFYLWDRRAYRRETIAARVEDIAKAEPLWVRGRFNFWFLGGVVIAVFLPTPLREGVMLLMALFSYFVTPKEIHEKNGFNFHPIVEVATLFAGIFITMVPAFLLLETNAHHFPISRPWQFFWLTGSLSSFLDNAPTYLAFFTLGQGEHLTAAPEMIQGIPVAILQAISCGAVLMGANTYIGNGPNFMVKAISDQMGVKTPSFFGYYLYSLAILFPLYFLLTFLFF